MLSALRSWWSGWQTKSRQKKAISDAEAEVDELRARVQESRQKLLEATLTRAKQ